MVKNLKYTNLEVCEFMMEKNIQNILWIMMIG